MNKYLGVAARRTDRAGGHDTVAWACLVVTEGEPMTRREAIGFMCREVAGLDSEEVRRELTENEMDPEFVSAVVDGAELPRTPVWELWTVRRDRLEWQLGYLEQLWVNASDMGAPTADLVSAMASVQAQLSAII